MIILIVVFGAVVIIITNTVIINIIVIIDIDLVIIEKSFLKLFMFELLIHKSNGLFKCFYE